MPSPKTIGFLGACTAQIWDPWVKAFEQQLGQLGWTINTDVKIDYQWAAGLEKNYTAWAKYFVGNKVDVIVTGGTQSVIACKKATANLKPPIPVVFATAGDPIDTKLVPTFSQTGNLTGLSNQQTNLVIKKLDMLRILLDGAQGKTHVGLIGNDKSPNVKVEMKIAELVAPTFGIKLHKRSIRQQKDIARVIRGLKGTKVKGLLVCTDPLITTHAAELNAEAAAAQLVTLHAFREYLNYGGFMSYGPKFVELFQGAARMVDKILRGPAGQNIPLDQTSDFEFAINLPPFRKIGLTVPPSLLALANHVVQ